MSASGRQRGWPAGRLQNRGWSLLSGNNGAAWRAVVSQRQAQACKAVGAQRGAELGHLAVAADEELEQREAVHAAGLGHRRSLVAQHLDELHCGKLV